MSSSEFMSLNLFTPPKLKTGPFGKMIKYFVICLLPSQRPHAKDDGQVWRQSKYKFFSQWWGRWSLIISIMDSVKGQKRTSKVYKAAKGLSKSKEKLKLSEKPSL